MARPLDIRTVADYERQAETLLSALKSGDNDAAWRFKWEHPRFGGKTIDEVNAATPDLDLDDARLVVAQQQSFETWADLVAFVDAVVKPGAVATFENDDDAQALVLDPVLELAQLRLETAHLLHIRFVVEFPVFMRRLTHDNASIGGDCDGAEG